MTITLNEQFLYYWIFTVIFETIYVLIQWNTFKKRKEQYEYLVKMKETMFKTATLKLTLKLIFNPLGYLIMFLFFSLVSQIMFTFSLIRLSKKMVGYKSKLEKQAEQESKAYERAKEWRKNEGGG